MDYIRLRDIPKTLGIKSGDKVLVNSAIRDVIHICKENGDENDLNVLIDAFIEAVGNEGTIMFPTYNWDWCKGVAFDYLHTPSKVGALSQVALERKDFKRTKHPIYSFAVWGKDQDYLCSLDNISAFGPDSPFKFFRDNSIKNVIINCKFADSFTFVHYVEEENLNKVKYRYLKEFEADYTDEDRNTERRKYQMCVRSYAYDVKELVDPYEEKWISAGAQENTYINGIKYSVINLSKTYQIIEEDILTNSSRCLCSYKGQNGQSLSLEQEIIGLFSEIGSTFEGSNSENSYNKLCVLKSYIPQMEICSEKNSENYFGVIALDGCKKVLLFPDSRASKQMIIKYE